MRDSTDRRHPRTTSPSLINDSAPGMTAVDRRKILDRRMENLTLEERQLLLSEMPSLKPPGSD